MNKIILPIFTAVTLAAATLSVRAADPDPEPWQFLVTIPLWAPQISGTATVKGHQADVNVNFNQLKDHLDASFALAMEAHKGNFGIFGNFGYMKFSGGFSGPLGGHVDADLKFLIANGGVSYQLVKVGEERPFILTGTAGIRYWYAATELSHRDASNTRDWQGGNNYDVVDPVFGLRITQYLTQKLHIDLAGDGGGFNLNHDTDWTWSASGMLTYDVAKWCSLSAGFQAVALDESQGNGKNQHGVNLIFNGVAAAATFKF